MKLFSIFLINKSGKYLESYLSKSYLELLRTSKYTIEDLRSFKPYLVKLASTE